MAEREVLRHLGQIERTDVTRPSRKFWASGPLLRTEFTRATASDGENVTRRRLERTVWAFVLLGVFLRVAHYLANYPLWGDEAFLALSCARRGYLQLLRPLEFAQVCPILFLWAELTAVKLFGFSELPLRLCPLLCGIASVFLFRWIARRILDGPALLMAVAIFAVSIHPIRHSADIKPYATDTLVAMGLLALAFNYQRSPQRIGWLWALVCFVPVALAASYPAALVAGGIGLALVPTIWKTWQRGPLLALAAYALVVPMTFVALHFGYMHSQRGTGIMLALQKYWADSFPPLDSPLRLAQWLITTHAGSMFAYPGGGNRGASSLTLILVVAGAFIFWRRGQRTILALLVAPMIVALLAAALRLYPYGGQARIMQYLAPAICLMAGLGLSAVLNCLPRSRRGNFAFGGVSIALAISGLALVAADFRHPYRALYDYQAREFARRFWPEQSRTAELACLNWDFGIRRPKTAGARTAIYLCNQLIYSPNRKHGIGPNWALVTSDRPLRCVAFDDGVLEQPEATAWLESMKRRFVLRGRSEVVVPSMGLHGRPWVDRITIFEFLPKPEQTTAGLSKIPATAG